MMQGKAELLGKIPMFSSLSADELNEVAQIAIARNYETGAALFHEGEPCPGQYIIAGGSVKIVKTTPSGRQVMLAIEMAPATVAEIPVFDGGPAPATVTALEPTTALLLLRKDFQGLIRRKPEIGMKLLAVVGRRLRQLVGLVESITFGSVRQRLAQALLESMPSLQAGAFPMPGTHEELASRLGTVREVVSRNLSRFQAEGLIRIERRQVTVLDAAGLQREAQTEL